MKLPKLAKLKLVFLLLPLCGVAVRAQSPNPGSPQRKVSAPEPSENNAQQQKRETPQAPIATVPTPRTEEISPQQNQHYADCYFQKAGRWIMSKWNVNYTIALATCVYALFAIFQWCALNKTVAQTQRLVRVAKQQADAADRQVTNLEKTLAATVIAANAAKASADAALRTDRPVLVAERFIPHNIYPREGLPESERTTVVGFWIRNCGKGPALSVELAGLLTLKDKLPYPASIGACRPISIRDTVVPSGGDLEVRVLYLLNEVESPITQEEINAIDSGETKLFIYGIVHYRDIHRGRYATWFGCEYRPSSFGAKMGFSQAPQNTTVTAHMAQIRKQPCGACGLDVSNFRKLPVEMILNGIT